jgi:hypothetical protein
MATLHNFFRDAKDSTKVSPHLVPISWLDNNDLRLQNRNDHRFSLNKYNKERFKNKLFPVMTAIDNIF